MLKITGAVMIFAACCGMGYGKSVEYKRRIHELLIWKKLLLMLRGEIKYARAPLAEAFASIGKRVEHMFGEFFLQLSGDMKKQQGETFQQLWERELKPAIAKSTLQKEDYRQFCQLGTQLGYLDREMQLSVIDFHVEQLEGRLKQLEREQGRQSRVYNCLGVFAGVMLNMILL